MNHPWTPEHEIDEGTAAMLVATQFPALAPVRVRAYGVGWDNVAFLINEAFVFRFPRRSIAVPLLQTEARILPMLAPMLPLAVPVPVYVGKPSLQLPAMFTGYRCLKGTTACRARLDATARSRAAKPLAAFLRSLHAFPLAQAQAAGLPNDELARTDVVLRKAQTHERLSDLLSHAVLMKGDIPWPLLEDAQAPPPHPACVVHGDLYARHVLVNAHGEVNGVIDWGDVHAGHPGLDLSLAYAFLPPSAREVFFAHYGPVHAATHAFAQFRALFSAIAIIHYGHAVGDEALRDEGKEALVYLRALSQ